MDKPPKAAFATNMNTEFTIFWVAADTAFLLSSGSSPHDLLPANNGCRKTVLLGSVFI
jgi:hypothetical protein